MSRSRRKSPFIGTCGHSEKYDKRINNRKMRRINKVFLQEFGDQDKLTTMQDVSDPWGMYKDGRIFFDPEERPEYMRK